MTHDTYFIPSSMWKCGDEITTWRLYFIKRGHIQKFSSSPVVFGTVKKRDVHFLLSCSHSGDNSATRALTTYTAEQESDLNEDSGEVDDDGDGTRN